MRWSRVRLIFRRELVDQLRDRRTVFMIFGLPILLYPILGYTVKELTAAFDQKARRVVVLGAEHLPDEPPLLTREADGTLEFNPDLAPPGGPGQLIVTAPEPDAERPGPAAQLEALRRGEADAYMEIPPDVRRQIEELERPTFRIAYLRSDEQSLATYQALQEIIGHWQDRIVSRRLTADEKPDEYIAPVEVEAIDLAREVTGTSASGASIWARIFPFLLVMMSLTGAFYPAIDLCAGEKERGTMETLLISPAYRSEIVVGKFLTIMAASVGTALLNLASMGLTMSWVAAQLGVGGGAVGEPGGAIDELSPPSFAALAWMVALLIPLAAFFSAICLSLAVLARSMKEGQYYMTPLYMIAMPLIFLTLMPGVELNPYYSLVPITGVSLLLKELMLEQYREAWTYFPVVLISTIVYGAMALRWAVGQFRTEEVLFREAERFDLGSWLRHLVRDRGPLPSGGMAIACFLVIITMSWYTSMLLTGSDPLAALAIGQVVFILGPPVVMALAFTSAPLKTLRLRWPGWGPIALGAALAVTLNPLSSELQPLVLHYFPIPDAIAQAVAMVQAAIPNVGTALLLFALLPAICEEFAFRGFILSGLDMAHRRWTAIVLSAFLFGFLHVLLSLSQQFFNATLLGLLLGLMALRTRSILPGIAFHVTNNALAVLLPTYAAGVFFRSREPYLYHYPWLAVGVVGSVALLFVLTRIGLPIEPSGPVPDVEAEDPPPEARLAVAIAAEGRASGSEDR